MTTATTIAEQEGDVSDQDFVAESSDEYTKEMTRRRDERLVVVREERFAKRKAALDDDMNLDPRRREFYLDRTLWDTRRCAEELDISTGRVSELRGGRRTANGEPLPTKSEPHPGLFPSEDIVKGKSPEVEAGRVRQWAEQRGTHILNLDTGELIKTRVRHGRPRHARTTLSKPHAPGTPRRGKKKDTD